MALMDVTGAMLIGSRAVLGNSGEIHAINPATGEQLQPAFGGGSISDVDAACTLADAAFDSYRNTGLEQRAQFLDAIAQGLLDLGEQLIERVIAETGLPRPRIEGERGRTVGQLRLFAAVVRDGRWLNVTIDPALPDRKPLARADLRSQKIAFGPVAIFGASNFPLAFSVAGGDTASALAAGCPVVVKSHPSHLGTSELVGRAIQKAVADCGLHEGVFSLLVDSGTVVSEALVQHPAIQAVGFTGSRRVGQQIVALAAARKCPIPVYAEMSSINPVFLLPTSLAQRTDSIAQGLVDSFTLGCGQFCTKPGLVIAINGPDYQRFCNVVAASTAAKPATTMLNAGIHNAYTSGVEQWLANKNLQCISSGVAPSGNSCSGQAMAFTVAASYFLQFPKLLEEVFGPASLLVECSNAEEMLKVANALDGQLTASIHMDEADLPLAQSLLPLLERRSGRILFNGFPTGVEVCHAMVHGGPAPATSDVRSTSVGAMAIERFLRPVCYQDMPTALLPSALQTENPLRLPRLLDGKLQLP